MENDEKDPEKGPPEPPSGQGRLRDDLAGIRRKLARLRRAQGEVVGESAGETGPESAAPAAPAAPQNPADSRVLGSRLRRLRTPPGALPSAPARQPATAGCLILEEAVAGVELPGPGDSATYLVTASLAENADSWGFLAGRLAAELASGDTALARWLRRVARVEGIGPEDLLFFDLETTGLEGSPLFLIGALAPEAGGLVARQFFARHYGEEAATIAAFLEYAASKRLAVSFNGLTFDVPYLRLRCAATGVPFALAPGHLDLLPAARRKWRGSVPDCKLQTLEKHICGREERENDLPGSEIPQAYHDFVLTGDAARMVTVLRHNLLDLVTLAELLVHLAEPEAKV